MQSAVDSGIPLRQILALPVVIKIARMKVQLYDKPNKLQEYFKDLEKEIISEFQGLAE